jgi:hypothetical protein
MRSFTINTFHQILCVCDQMKEHDINRTRSSPFEDDEKCVNFSVRKSEGTGHLRNIVAAARQILQERQYTRKVTLRRFRATVFAVEKQ